MKPSFLRIASPIWNPRHTRNFPSRPQGRQRTLPLQNYEYPGERDPITCTRGSAVWAGNAKCKNKFSKGNAPASLRDITIAHYGQFEIQQNSNLGLKPSRVLEFVYLRGS